MIMEPNTYCKYSKCTNGKDGGKAHYYSCLICSKRENWRSVACCEEHYHLYIEEVLAARANGKKVDTVPDRTDMSKEEFKKNVVEKPMEQIETETKKEFTDAGYGEFFEENGLTETVDKINDDIKSNSANKKYTRKMKPRNRVKVNS